LKAIKSAPAVIFANGWEVELLEISSNPEVNGLDWPVVEDWTIREVWRDSWWRRGASDPDFDMQIEDRVRLEHPDRKKNYRGTVIGRKSGGRYVIRVIHRCA
jgi:hypothetical protein